MSARRAGPMPLTLLLLRRDGEKTAMEKGKLLDGRGSRGTLPTPVLPLSPPRAPLTPQPRGLSRARASSPIAAAHPALFSRSLELNRLAFALHSAQAEAAVPLAMLLQLRFPPPSQQQGLSIPVWPVGHSRIPGTYLTGISGATVEAGWAEGARGEFPTSAWAEQGEALDMCTATCQHVLGRVENGGFGV